MPQTLVVSWEALDALVGRLAEGVGGDYDLVLAITRGGLVPAGMLAYRVGLREILVAGAEFYLTDGRTQEAPRIGHFPESQLLSGQRVLVVDEVWETARAVGRGPGHDGAPAPAHPGLTALSDFSGSGA